MLKFKFLYKKKAINDRKRNFIKSIFNNQINKIKIKIKNKNKEKEKTHNSRGSVGSDGELVVALIIFVEKI